MTKNMNNHINGNYRLKHTNKYNRLELYFKIINRKVKMKGTKFIETDRLILRKITMNDSHDLFINWGSDIKTNEFLTFSCHKSEENTKKIEELIRQREKNIALANKLKETLEVVQNKEDNWKETVKSVSRDFPEDIIDTLSIIGRSKSTKSQNYQDAVKLINARIVNLESNLHIEIDMERIEDRSKALSYIGIEIADALKLIPAPQDDPNEVEAVLNEIEQTTPEEKTYFEQTRVEVKPTLWQRFKNSKFVKAIKYAMKVRIVVQIPALPEGRGEENHN